MTPGIAKPGAAWRTRAVLVEVEGVLLDTAAGTEAAWHWWSHRVGLDGEDLAEAARGRTVTDVVTESLTGHTAELDIEEQVSHVEDRLELLLRSATRRRGAGSLLRALPPGRVAIVSSWRGTHLDAAVRRARIRRPAVVISADDVPTGRPDPAGHLAAARALGVEPSDCTTFEHSAVGIAAGVSAGMRTVGIAPGVATQHLSGADVLLHHPGAVHVTADADGLELRVAREPKRIA